MTTNWFKEKKRIIDDIHRKTWSMDMIITAIKKQNEFERNCESWKIEWEKNQPTKAEREQMFDITPQGIFELRRIYLLGEVKNSAKDYYEAIQNKLNSETIKMFAKNRMKAQLQYFFFTYKPEKNNNFSEQELGQVRNIEMRTLIQINKSGFSLCPFHNEKTPSFKTFNNLWYCFGCGIGGDTISFIMKKEGLDFRAAIMFLLKKI